MNKNGKKFLKEYCSNETRLQEFKGYSISLSQEDHASSLELSFHLVFLGL